MKILQIIPYFPPAYGFGGPGVLAYNLSKELVKRKNSVFVFTSDANDLYTRINSDKLKISEGINIYYFKNISFLAIQQSKLFITPQLICAMKKEIQTFDIVHLHEYRSFQNIVAHHYLYKFNIPYILQAHGALPQKIGRSNLKILYDNNMGYKLLKNAAYVIALNEIEVNQYENMGVPLEKIVLIPNGIDLSEYTVLPSKGSFKRKFEIKGEEKIILYLGRLHNIKGVDTLIKAYANVIKKLECVRLVIVGPNDGSLNELQGLVKNLGIKNKVLFTGPLYGLEKIEAYVDSEVYVLPSRYETFPMTVLEAYACDKPVIASNVEGLKDLVLDEVTGFLFKPGNVEQLTSYLLDLLNDTNKAKFFGSNGKKFVRTFDIKKVTDSFEKLYRKIIK